jgi:peptidyl-prolyl cis-trans isomerase SurA
MRGEAIERMMTMVRNFGALFLGLVMAVSLAAPALAAVKVTVNGTPITDVQIAQRVKLLALEGGGGTKGATEQLINEVIQVDEAKRVGIVISESQIDGAFLTVARNLKMSEANLKKVLTQQGVNMQTLRDRLKASLAWQAVVGQVVNQNVQVSDSELDAKAAGKVNAANSYDYILKEVLFIGGGGRSGQANSYRAAFKGCDSAVQLSTKYTDVAVTDVGRRHATQLPDALAKELAGINVGGITKPRVVSNGVSMLAVCSKSEARDLTFIKDTIRQEAGNDQLKNAADKYLKDLRAKARISYN